MTDQKPTNTEAPFNFRDAVQEAYAMHPRMAGTVFFMDGTDNTIFHPNHLMAQWAAGMANVDFSVTNAIYTHGKDRMSVAVRAMSGLRFILLYPDNPLDDLYGKKMPLNQRLYFTFDHELGHAIVKPGTEQAADAYAALRHVQRFGNDTAWIRRISLGRALSAASAPDNYSAVDHYTSPILQRVVQIAGTRDLGKMSPLETIKLAEKIVSETPMKPASKLRQDFQKAFAPYNAANEDAALRVKALAQTVMETDDREVFTCGKLVLEGLLDGKVFHQTNDNKTLHLQGREWDTLRARFNRNAKDRRAQEKQQARAARKPSTPQPQSP